MPQRLNTTDKALLALLSVDARLSVSALARKLGKSRSTVQDRLRRLEESGVIAGYGLRLGAEAGLDVVRAIIMLHVVPRALASVVSILKRRPDITVLHAVSGKIDLVAEVACASPEAIDKTLDFIGKLDGVESTESAIILSTKFDRRL